MLRLSRLVPAGLLASAVMSLSACVSPQDDSVALGLPGALNTPSDKETYLWGTGFFISRNGEILTAHHVVNDCGRIDVIAAGQREPATLVASSATDDLSLLRIPDPLGEPLSLAPSTTPTGGAFVAVEGYDSLAASSQTIAFNSMVLPNGTPRHIALASEAAPGYSGSPVVTMDGRVVGVLESKLTRSRVSATFGQPREIRLAVDGAATTAFLQSQNLSSGDDPSTPFESIGARLAAAEVKVECHGLPASQLSQLP